MIIFKIVKYLIKRHKQPIRYNYFLNALQSYKKNLE